MSDTNNNNNNNNGNNTPKVMPIARTGGTQNSPSENQNIFSQVYQEKKVQAQSRDVSTPQNGVSSVQQAKIPVVNVTATKKQDENDKKFKAVFIILIILIVVLLLSSVLFLIFGQQKEDDKGNITDDTPIAENMNSAVLTSPFDATRFYGVEFPEGMKEEYKALYAQNSDFVGWLTVPGTCIDTPCYQKKSSTQYYLKRDNYDQYTKYGIPFLDSGCDAVNLSRNTVIYGHNFDDGLIFDELHNYQDPEYYKQYPIIEFSTLYKDYKFKIIAAFHTNGSSSGDNDYLFYYVAPIFGNNSLMKFHNELLQRSYIHTGVDVQPGDKLITLSTCTYFFDRNGSLENARFAVIGRLVRDGESESIDPSLVTKNENVRYPQLYYDVFGGTNPWRNDTKWVPEAN